VLQIQIQCRSKSFIDENREGNTLIETEGLTKKFGGITAVDALTLSVDEGEVFGFLGPNGAGKTTTVRMLCCLISKTSGVARIAGYDVGNDADALRIRKLIGLVPDNVGLYEVLSAYDNLDFYGKLYDCPEARRKENIQRFLSMLGLWEKKDGDGGTDSLESYIEASKLHAFRTSLPSPEEMARMSRD
jgi:ABC-2 type transport system ATP-binding protein